MRPVQDIRLRADEIRGLIASDQLPEATKRLLDLATDFSDRDTRNEAIVLSSKRTRLDREQRTGLLDFDKADAVRTRLLFQALALVDTIEEQPRPEGLS